ncbi:hypothetical protein GGI04_002637 [Coemansia thaxteri]|uniref:Uncharacterized protein n=1 Tax=Coemansia thaxteri TaxID=2663907 RepID=A0A9W8BGL1_9FUNG|nr:hypothetical protein GGI04_002637 [Coemansia thaxteri]KAJ2006965.1 hypothetical protein H4R26_001068 [Coemansia thaxteri]KAJ2472178.1 hypothetical protein GGI02_001758 [Coemansia sp. RSA 2322]
MAPTLLFLEITYKAMSHTERLFVDRDGSPVVYSKLQSLVFKTWDDELISYRPVADNAEPFPALRRLEVYMEYPFGDDVLFRGNSDTLRKVHLELDVQTVIMMKRHNIFAANKFKNLWI